MICPCCSGKNYSDCCKLYHDGLLPDTALALMRSRYSAYALKIPKYIIATTHPDSPYVEKNLKKWEKGILDFCISTEFVKLEILDYSENTVFFVAHLKQNGKNLILKEQSLFANVEGKWLYLRKIE